MKESVIKKTFLLTTHVLEPEVPAGATLVCVSLPPRNGDLIVYVPFQGEPVFRRYLEHSDGRILLESLNSRYDSYTARKEEMLSRGTLWSVVSFHRILREDAGNPYDMSSPGRDTETHPPVSSVSDSASGVRNGEELLTFTEAGTVLKVRRTRLYAMLRSGELHAVKVGKLWRVSRSSIEEYLSRSVYPGNKHRENKS